MNPSLARPWRPSGYQMIKTFKIRNFRGFKSAGLENCRRMNVVVGDNGSGKTAFLEALFMVGGPSPEVALRIRNWRGFEGNVTGTAASIEEALWRDLFFDFDRKRGISISIEGAEPHTRTLGISYTPPSDLKIPLSEAAAPIAVSAPITFEWRGPYGRHVRITPTIIGGALQMPPVQDVPTETFFFGSNIPHSALESASRFSILSKASREDEFVKVMRRIFPDLLDISIEIAGGTALLFAKTAAFAEKVPLPLLSTGLNKLASIYTAIASQRRSIVLVDELENGFYFRRLPGIWKALRELCKENDVQLFATTHSAECLEAAGALAEEAPEDFSVIHVGRKDGESHLRQFDGTRFAEALDENIEIR